MRGEYLYEEREVRAEDRPFEFFMNRFRLLEAVPKNEFEQFTGLPLSSVENTMAWAQDQKFITETDRTWQVTEHGKLFLNELLEGFLLE